MVIRYSKTLLTIAMALLATLVALGNITDYGSNFEFVRHVMQMDSIFPDARIHYRAVNSSTVHHAAYILIIALELLTGILCWVGAWAMFVHRRTRAARFNRAKHAAIWGLTLGFLVWQVGFMSVGGEWFGMWMSGTWNGVPSAFRFFMTMGLVLVYVAMPDVELDAFEDN